MMRHFFFSEPGLIQFEKRGYLVKESVGDAEVNVVRQNGADGIVTVNWSTQDKTAVTGKDYKGGNGVLTFNHGEVSNRFAIWFLCGGGNLNPGCPLPGFNPGLIPDLSQI